MVNGVAGFFERLGEVRGMAMHAPGDFAQAFGAVVDGIHRCHHGEQNLGGADVAGRLVATDVLLAGLERQAEGGIAGGVFRDSDEAAGEAAFVFVARGEEGSVGTAEARGDTKALA